MIKQSYGIAPTVGCSTAQSLNVAAICDGGPYRVAGHARTGGSLHQRHEGNMAGSIARVLKSSHLSVAAYL
jgi:hypothetical protein